MIRLSKVDGAWPIACGGGGIVDEQLLVECAKVKEFEDLRAGFVCTSNTTPQFTCLGYLIELTSHIVNDIESKVGIISFIAYSRK
jgi:hypothetical protein